MEHETQADYTCPICHWIVMPQIPHECNFFICHQCLGTGTVGWRDRFVCPRCVGTGRWDDKPEEENPEGVLV